MLLVISCNCICFNHVERTIQEMDGHLSCVAFKLNLLEFSLLLFLGPFLPAKVILSQCFAGVCFAKSVVNFLWHCLRVCGCPGCSSPHLQ